ncbi:MAG: twin-arginine translocase subunit TatC [Armatimonadetes bacterium]|nr:MAG: twin-arginine translocase subunit TatC [Armatimonadota bacterium]
MAQPYRYEEPEEGGLDPEDPESKKATLFEHLDELRARIMRSLVMLSVGWLIGWFVEEPVYFHLRELLFDPNNLPEGVNVTEAFRNFGDPFFLKLKVSFVIGAVMSAPFIVLELWGFIKPALYPKEKKAFRVLGPTSFGLFLIGALFGYLILRPAFHWFLGFLLDFPGTQLIQEPGALVVFVLKMLLAFGLGFQLPIVVWFLAKVELITSEGLIKNWRTAVVVIVASAAMLTPGGDFFSLAMMSVPMLVLYFVSIAAVKVTEKRRKKERAAEGYSE